MNAALAKFILARPCGFITDDDRRELEKLDRLALLVVRCECCRFMCAVQDLPMLLGYVRAGGGRLRDVSIAPVLIDQARAFKPEPPKPPRPAPMRFPGKVREPVPQRIPVQFDESQCGGAFDGNQVTSDADPGL